MITVLEPLAADMSTLFCSGCEGRLELIVGSSTEDRISPTPRLLGTNQVPSLTEARAIRQCLSEVEDEVKQLESQITQIQSILIMLESKHKKLKSFAHEHRGLLSPLRRLFPELLSEIFSWCPRGAPIQPEHSIVQVPDSFDPLHGPLLVSQICHSWRSAAITTPELWTTIRLVLGPISKFRIEILDLFLSRSGDCDLTIGVTDKFNIDNFVATNVAESSHVPQLRLLAREARRWKSAIFNLLPYRMYWDALSEAKGKTNRLHHLSVYHSLGRLEEPVVEIFVDSPALTSLSLNSNASLGDLLIDKSRITHFRYETAYAPLDLCIEAMQSLPNLEHCVLNCFVEEPNNFPIADIVLSNLKYLDIKMGFVHGTHQDQPGAFWDALQLPNLSFLKLVEEPSLSDSIHYAPIQLSRLLGRCRQLTKLGIVWPSAPAHQLLEVIQHATAVRCLSLGLGEETFHVVLSSLAQTESSSSQLLMPSLRSIRIYPVANGSPLDVYLNLDCNVPPPSDGFLATFIQMAQARMTPAPARNSDIALLGTASLHYPLDVEAAVEAMKACLDSMGIPNSDLLTFPAQLHFLKDLQGSRIKIRRS